MTKYLYIPVLAVAALFSISNAVSEVTVAVTPQKYAALPGDVFPVEYTVSRTDDSGDYVILPPEVPVLEWGTAVLLKMHTTGKKTRFIVGYHADTAGIYTVPGLTIRLATGLGDSVADISKLDETTPTQVIETAPVEVQFQNPRIGLWIGTIVVVLLAAGGLVLFRMRKSNRNTSENSHLSSQEQAGELLHEARRNRLDGDYYAFYRALHGALTCIATVAPEPHTALHEKIKLAIDDTGYRGIRPSDDVLEGDFKDVERIVAQEQQRAAKEN